ncbi:MAG: PKD domain-containing protein [Chloroflexi bacterium]|nr:PKD domain-containing protein [Chloroflexota bacterium]
MTVLNKVPLVSGPIVAQPNAVSVRKPVEVTAPFSDPGTLDTHRATWDWGDGTSSSSTVVETRGSGTASGSHTYAAAGFYTVTLTVADKDGASAQQSYKYVVVYDPEAGFIDGGGTVESSAGFYRANQSLSGRLIFAFTARYQRDATVPTGQTEVQFQAGNLRFDSTGYDWLVLLPRRGKDRPESLSPRLGQGQRRGQLRLVAGYCRRADDR